MLCSCEHIMYLLIYTLPLATNGKTVNMIRSPDLAVLHISREWFGVTKNSFMSSAVQSRSCPLTVPTPLQAMPGKRPSHDYHMSGVGGQAPPTCVGSGVNRSGEALQRLYNKALSIEAVVEEPYLPSPWPFTQHLTQVPPSLLEISSQVHLPVDSTCQRSCAPLATAPPSNPANLEAGPLHGKAL